MALNKTKERMRPYHVIHENEDPDIKKIKKVIEASCAFMLASLFPSSGFYGCERVASMGTLMFVSPQVQSFMRGWLCRRKWKIIVQDYICSPHAESMRKRNQIVFNMVEAETEYVNVYAGPSMRPTSIHPSIQLIAVTFLRDGRYVHQLYILVNCFLRPLRMAASSKKPPISHDDVSSIFLNRCLNDD